jgi:hypothetical protein
MAGDNDPSNLSKLPSLYIVENVTSGEGAFETKRLVRLSFGKDGEPLKKTVLTKDDRFFSHFGNHRIVEDRYMVTTYGGVIDLQTGKVINDEEDGKLLGVESGQVVYEVNDSKHESGLFAFDLRTRNLEKMKNPGGWALPGVKSQDKKLSVEATHGGLIYLHKLDGTKKQLGKDYFIEWSLLSSLFDVVPCVWLDDKRILTQRANGKLVILSVDGTEETIPEIKPAPAVISAPRLWFDLEKRLIYSGGTVPGPPAPTKAEYLIDVKTKKATPLKEYALGNGFRTPTERKENGDASVEHKGQSIGSQTFRPFEAVTAPGLIAMPIYDPPDLDWARGVAMWNDKSRKWQTIRLDANSLIGWSK